MASMRITIVLTTAACVVLTGASLVTLSAMSTRSRAVADAKRELLSATGNVADTVGTRLRGTRDVARTLAQTLGATQDKKTALDLKRESAIGILQIALYENPRFRSVFTVWEPEAYDQLDSANRNVPGHDATGRFVAQVTRGADQMAVVAPTQDYAEVKGTGPADWNLAGYYQALKADGQVRLMTPRTEGGHTYSVVLVPIVVEEKFYGVVGVDLELTDVETTVAEFADRLPGSEVMLLSGESGGRVIAGRGAGVTAGTVLAEAERSKWPGLADARSRLASGSPALVETPDELVAYDVASIRMSSKGAASGTPTGTAKTGTAGGGNEAGAKPGQAGQDEVWMLATRTPRALVMAPARRAVINQVAVGSGLCLAALMVTYILAGTVTRPMRRLVESLKAVTQGDGDLTRRLQINRSDEIGQLSHHFDEFVGHLQELVRRIQATSVQVTGAAGNIAEVNGRLADRLLGQDEVTRQVASAVEEMRASAAESARQVGVAAGAASGSGEQARKGGQVVQTTVAEMRAIAEDVKTQTSSLSTLAKATDEIGKIVGVIATISAQTQLLALNATIEAARAGEHGRGFAVVADEVRQLSMRTTEATTEIEQAVRSIREETARVVGRIDSGSKRVIGGAELAGQAGTSLEAIVTSSDEVDRMVRSVALAAEEQSRTSEGIARSVVEIQQGTSLSAQDAQTAAQVAHSMRERSDELRQLVTRFKA